MALRRRFTGQSQTRSPRRLTSWGFGPSAQLVLGTTPKQLWTQAISSTSEPKLTIVRIRGWIRIICTNQLAVGDGFFGAVGIGIVSDEAFAAGASAVPDPRSTAESDWEWMWHSFFDVHGITSAEADGSNAVAVEWSKEIDSRAMRKMDGSQTMIGVMGATEEGTAVGELFADTRLLLKLS